MRRYARVYTRFFEFSLGSVRTPSLTPRYRYARRNRNKSNKVLVSSRNATIFIIFYFLLFLYASRFRVYYSKLYTGTLRSCTRVCISTCVHGGISYSVRPVTLTYRNYRYCNSYITVYGQTTITA